MGGGENEEGTMTDEKLVTAEDLEVRGILRKATAYRMAKLKLIPCSYVGAKRRGVRFFPSEVLAALRRPKVDEFLRSPALNEFGQSAFVGKGKQPT